MDFPIITNDVILEVVQQELASQKDPKDENLVELTRQGEWADPVRAWSFPTFYNRDNCFVREGMRYRDSPFTALNEIFENLYPKGGKGGFIIAGGAVLKALRHQGTDFLQDLRQSGGDIDLFPVSLSPEKGEAMIQNFIETQEVLAVQERDDDLKVHSVYRTQGAVTVLTNNMTVQFVTRKYRSVAAVLHNFDIAACAVAWDGSKVLATRLAYFTYTLGVYPMMLTRFRVRAEKRFAKYFSKGFGLIMINADTEKVWKDVSNKEDLQFTGLKITPATDGHIPPNHIQCTNFQANSKETELEKQLGYPPQATFDKVETIMELNIRMIVSANRASIWRRNAVGEWVVPLMDQVNTLTMLITMFKDVHLANLTRYLRMIPTGIDNYPLVMYAVKKRQVEEKAETQIDPQVTGQLEGVLVPQLLAHIREKLADFVDPTFVWREENEVTVAELPKSQVVSWFGKYYVAN